jgi:hypothetical protein
MLVPTKVSRCHFPTLIRKRPLKNIPWYYWVLLIFTMLVIPAIIATAVLLVGRAHAAPTTSSTEVDLGYTKYTGTTLGNGINQFLGIRFADAPTGDNRFKAPQPPKNFPPGPANKVCSFSHLIFISLTFLGRNRMSLRSFRY